MYEVSNFHAAFLLCTCTHPRTCTVYVYKCIMWLEHRNVYYQRYKQCKYSIVTLIRRKFTFHGNQSNLWWWCRQTVFCLCTPLARHSAGHCDVLWQLVNNLSIKANVWVINYLVSLSRSRLPRKRITFGTYNNKDQPPQIRFNFKSKKLVFASRYFLDRYTHEKWLIIARLCFKTDLEWIS